MDAEWAAGFRSPAGADLAVYSPSHPHQPCAQREYFFPRRFKASGERSQPLARTKSHLDMRYMQPAKYKVINHLRTKLVCCIQGLIAYRAVKHSSLRLKTRQTVYV